MNILEHWNNRSKLSTEYNDKFEELRKSASSLKNLDTKTFGERLMLLKNSTKAVADELEKLTK